MVPQTNGPAPMPRRERAANGRGYKHYTITGEKVNCRKTGHAV